MNHLGYSLHQALPAEVVLGGQSGFATYKNYPVFSWTWLWKRGVFLSGFFSLFALLVAVVIWAVSASHSASLFVFAYLFGLLILIAFLGPAIACGLRYLRLNLQSERILIVLALVAGIVANHYINQATKPFANSVMLPAMENASGPLAIQNLKLSKTDLQTIEAQIKQRTKKSPQVLWLTQAPVLALMFLLGGGLALRGYFSEQSRWQGNLRRNELDSLHAQKRESQMQLSVLQAQVEPHFLFNTMASVRSLIESEPKRAVEMIDAMVEFLRASIPQMRDDRARMESTLGQQMAICRHYLALMQLRMGARLRCTIELPAALESAKFPALMLISLVENAIKHGVEPAPLSREVRVSAKQFHQVDKPMLRVSVCDDGVGLSESIGSGLGLANIRAQLKTLYGDHGKLDVRNRSAGGVDASITIPLEFSV